MANRFPGHKPLYFSYGYYSNIAVAVKIRLFIKLYTRKKDQAKKGLAG
jgi:hypothetical protein